MYEKIDLRCSDVSDLMGFDLDLLESSLDFTPTAMIPMENTLPNLDGTYDDDSDSDDVSLTTDDSNQEWSSQISTSTHQSSGKRKSTANGHQRQLPGPKSRRRLEDMTPQEIARRQRRRERNKAAAARCRQRRLDVTNQLLAETQQLEAEGQRLEREIENLRKQRDQLEFVLEAHQPMCLGEFPDNMAVQLATTSGAMVSSMNTMPIVTRPNSLPIACSLAQSSSTSALFGVDSFDLGSTGVTPVVSAAGFNLFMGAAGDYVMSPTTLLGSPAYPM